MSARDDLEALIKRLEEAREGSEELDCWVYWRAVEPENPPPDQWHPNYRAQVRPYTRSVDAALSLVPEGAAWRVARHSHGWLSPTERHFTNEARLERYSAPGDKQYAIAAPGATPALALCRACLRARLAERKDEP